MPSAIERDEPCLMLRGNEEPFRGGWGRYPHIEGEAEADQGIARAGLQLVLEYVQAGMIMRSRQLDEKLTA